MNKSTEILFNPFTRIAGQKSLILGLMIMVLTIVLAYFSNTRFDGVLGIHNGESAPFYLYIIDALTTWLSLILIFYPISLIVTKFRSRFIDVAGTFLFARFPFIIPALLMFYLRTSEVNKFLESLVTKTNIKYSISIADWMLFLASLIIMILCTIWLVALYYKAFRVNTNLKGAKSVWVFIVGLVLAEALASLVFYFINGSPLN